MEKMKDLIERQAAIEAAIKATDDWDGGYNITRANMIEKELNELPSAQPDGEYISRQSVTESDLIDWYINSVDESEPVWTEEHIHELFNDFYLIPKED